MEPGWHRALRAKRKRARTFINKVSKVALGKRAIRRTRRTLALLRGHHSWNRADIPKSIRWIAPKHTMTWHCKFCNIPNSDTAEACKQCKSHWSQAWKQGRKREGSRTNSRPRPNKPKPAGKTKEKTQESPQEEPEWSVFAAKVPWLPSTPQTRLSLPKEKERESQELPVVPPQPVLPAPPTSHTGQSSVAPLSEEEQRLLSHLKGLKDLGNLPEVLLTQYQELETRNQEASNGRGLTHSHINRLHKARNQTQSLIKKLRDLDKEWQDFLQDAFSRLQLHANHFQQHRAELMEALVKKQKELEAVKAEVSTASQNVMGHQPQEESLTEPAVQAELQRFQEMAESLTQAGQIQFVEDDEMEVPEDPGDEEELKEEKDSSKSKPHLAPRPFRQAGSPQKVATTHLKEHKGKHRE